MVDICILGLKWVCDEYNDGITQENYNSILPPILDFTCNATEPQSTSTIVDAGCGTVTLGTFTGAYGYLETQACSGVGTYSILIVSIISVIFYFASL